MRYIEISRFSGRIAACYKPLVIGQGNADTLRSLRGVTGFRREYTFASLRIRWSGKSLYNILDQIFRVLQTAGIPDQLRRDPAGAELLFVHLTVGR